MALRFIESFDHYAAGDLTEKWDDWSCAIGSATLQAGRTGNCLQIYIQYGYEGRLYKNFDSQQTWIIGVAIYPGNLAFSWLLAFMDAGTYQVTLDLESNGALSVRRGDGGGATLSTSAAGVMSAEEWQYVEMKVTIDNAAGAVEVRVDDETVIDVSGVDTQNSGNASADRLALDVDGVGTVWNRYDDIYLCDGTGAIRNDFLGICFVYYGLPDGAGNYAQFTPSAGANWQCVDENPPNDDTDYNQSSGSGQRDSFAMTDPLAAAGAGDVLGVQTCLNAKKTEEAALTAENSMRISGTDYDGSSHSPTTSYKYYLDVWEQNPDTVANFSDAEIAALEVGYEHAS